MLSLSSLGALFFRGGLVRKVITGYSGDTFPNFTPNPWFARRVRTRRGRGRALVVPRVLAATRGRGARAAGDRDPFDRGVVDGGERRRSPRVDTPFGEVGLLAPLRARRRAAARAGRRPRRQRRAASAAARRRVGRARGPARRDRHRRADRRRRPAVVASRPDPRAPRARGRASARWARIPAGCYAGDAAGRRLRRGLRLLGRGPGRDARRRRLRRVDPALGARRRDAGAVARPARRRAGRARCGPRPIPTRGTPTRRRTRPTSTRR